MVSGRVWRITRRVAGLSKNETYLSARHVPRNQRQYVWTRTIGTSNTVRPSHAVVCVCDSLIVVQITGVVKGAESWNQAGAD